MKNTKVQIISHYLIFALFLVCWVIVMFFSDISETQGFRFFLGASVAVLVLYLLYERSHFPKYETSKVVKIIAIILMVLLVVRLFLG